MKFSSKLLIIIVTVTAYLLFSQYEIDKIGARLSKIYLPFRENINVKTILYWTHLYHRKDFFLGTGSAIFKRCAYSNCFATFDKKYLPIDKFDALIFHAVKYTVPWFGRPSKRNPKQRYIFFCLESPINSFNYMKHFNNFYNWTMTYRMDSDIKRPYGMFFKRKTNYRSPSIEEIQKRPKKIAWMVSNCYTQSERELIHSELNKFIPVDVYGKCGNLNCSKDLGSIEKGIKDVSSKECYKMIEQNYKFYLSFENSICEDYVTEKLYKILTRNIVPIVYGAANYTKIAPPNSVINVMDFKSIRDLAIFIKYLDAHPEAYLRFFEWKKDYVVTESPQKILCDLCEKLNEPIQPQIYSEVYKWWQGKKFDKCRYINVTRTFSRNHSGQSEIEEIVQLFETMKNYL